MICVISSNATAGGEGGATPWQRIMIARGGVRTPQAGIKIARGSVPTS